LILWFEGYGFGFIVGVLWLEVDNIWWSREDTVRGIERFI